MIWWFACSRPEVTRSDREVDRAPAPAERAGDEEGGGEAGEGGAEEPTLPPAEALRAVPLFRSPFRGEHPVSNFFDHGRNGDEQALITTGSTAYGIDGHKGYDFGMPIGTELFAMADGEVLKAGDLGPIRCSNGAMAKDNVQIVVLHQGPDGGSYVTELHHLSQVQVRPGDRVTAGQPVGRSGNSGCSSGPHLHLEVVTGPDPKHRYPFDPYGWSGAEPDPRAERGRPSASMWLPGEAPALRRSARATVTATTAYGPHRMVGTDGVDPIGGEWVEIGAHPDAKRPVSLAGATLRNAAGASYPLPDRTLAPGESFKVWTQRADLGSGDVSLGLDHELWDDRSDCAVLVDRTGAVHATLRFGRGPDRCPN
ncbi:MAG: peptidoglycan DD-metalloendopeptidase family protein [Myxococcota bacterium]